MNKRDFILTCMMVFAGLLTRTVFGFESFSNDMAISAGTPVEAITLRGLGNFKGRTVSVFHVSARENSIGMNGASLNVRSVKRAPLTAQVGSAGEVSFPATSVDRGGFDIFNYMIFVVHKAGQKDVYLKNVDGGIPTDPRLDGDSLSKLPASDFERDGVGYVSMTTFAKIKAAQGAQGTVQLDFPTDLK